MVAYFFGPPCMCGMYRVVQKFGTFLYAFQLHQMLTNFQTFLLSESGIVFNNTATKDLTALQVCCYTTL